MFRFQLLFTLSFCFINVSALNAAMYSSGKDHASEWGNHTLAAKKFIETQFKENKIYSKEKIEKFKDLLIWKCEAIAKDIEETRVLEKIELEVKKAKKVKEKAREKFQKEDHAIIKACKLYLIPKIEELSQCVSNSTADLSACSSAVDDFIRGYQSYFIPNAHRSIWPMDVDGFYAVKKVASSYKFNQNDKKYTEANNLLLEAELENSVNNCLDYKKKIGSYFSEDDIKKLKVCKFDLSLLNPGVSALWQNLMQIK